MDRNSIPEPIKSRLDKMWPDLSTEVKSIIETSIDICPDWKSAEDSIHNCLQLLMDDATQVQKLIQ